MAPEAQKAFRIGEVVRTPGTDIRGLPARAPWSAWADNLKVRQWWFQGGLVGWVGSSRDRPHYERAFADAFMSTVLNVNTGGELEK